MKHVGGYVRLLVLLAVQALALAPGSARNALASDGFVFNKAMLQGEVAPGTEPGTVFAPLNDGYFPTVPSIDEAGAVSFGAILEGPGVDQTNRSGVWSGDPLGISLVARAGQQAPGVPPGGVFAGFPFDFALIPPTAGGARLGFTATISGSGIDFLSDDGVWTRSAGQSELLAREGNPAAGLPSGVVFAPPQGLQINEAGHAFFFGSVRGSGIGSTNDEGFWSDRDGALTLLVREGDPAPDTDPGVRFGGAGEFVGTGYTFESVAWSNASKFGIQGNLTGSGVNTFNNEALFVEDQDGLRLLAREGDPAPGAGSGVTFGGNTVIADFGNIALSALGQAAFIARVGGSIPVTYPLFSDHTGSLAPVAFPGDPAPGTSGHFGILTDPLLSDGGGIAFRASLSESGQWPPLGVWWDLPGRDGELSPLVLPGDQVPGRVGATITSVDFILGFNAQGQLAFRASVDDPMVGARMALFLAEPWGELREIVASRDLFDIQGSAGQGEDLREVSEIRFGGMNQSGQMAIRLDFTDQSVGFYGVSHATTSADDLGPTSGIRLAQNVPNPFDASTLLQFELPEAARAGVNVYDAAGRLVTRLLDGSHAAGRHSIVWDGRGSDGHPLASGVYWARLETGKASRSVRMLLRSR